MRRFAAIYLDDVLVHSRDLSQHVTHVRLDGREEAEATNTLHTDLEAEIEGPNLRLTLEVIDNLKRRCDLFASHLHDTALRNRYFSIVCDHDFSGFDIVDIVDIQSCSMSIFRILNRSLRKHIATRGVGYATVDTAYHSTLLDIEIKDFDLRPARHPLMRLTTLTLNCISASRLSASRFSVWAFSENIDVFRFNGCRFNGSHFDYLRCLRCVSLCTSPLGFGFDRFRFTIMIGRSLASQAYTEPSSASHPHPYGLERLVFSLRFDVFSSLGSWLHGLRTRAFWHFRCASMFSVALLAALSAQSGRLLEPSSFRGEQHAHSLLGICQSRFIATAIEGVPLRTSFARPVRFVDSS
jgi:hypothetical protein